MPDTCILTGADGENPDDCTTHDHERQPGMLYPDSPCTVTITAGTDGGVGIELMIPTYSGGAILSLMTERDADGDWRIFIPWPDGMDEDRSFTIEGGMADAANGIVYMGCPDIPVDAAFRTRGDGHDEDHANRNVGHG